MLIDVLYMCVCVKWARMCHVHKCYVCACGLCVYICVYMCLSVCICVYKCYMRAYGHMCVCVCGYLLHTFVYSAYVLSVCVSYPLHLHICYTRAPKHSACVVHVQFVFKGVVSLHTCCKRV